MSKKTCFEYNILYKFAVMFQSSLYLSMAMDICFSIVLPIKWVIGIESTKILNFCWGPKYKEQKL